MDAKTHNEICRIVALICQRYNVTTDEIYAKRGKERIVTPRKIVSALIRDIYGYKISYPEIGSFFGGKPHCTILNHVKKIHDRCDVDKEFNITYHQLLNDARLAVNSKQKSMNIQDIKQRLLDIYNVDDKYIRLSIATLINDL